MRIMVRDFKNLLREALSAEENSKRSQNILREASETYTCSFDVTSDDKEKIRKSLATSGVTISQIRVSPNDDTEVRVRGTAEQVKAALRWGLRGSGERVSDYFEEYAKKSR